MARGSGASQLAAAQAVATQGSFAPAGSIAALPRLHTPVSALAATNATGGVVSLGSGLSLFLGMSEGGESAAREASWRGGVFFDEGFRDAARLSSVEAQELAALISDVTLFAVMIQGALVDAMLVPLAQGDPDLAWQASFAHSLALGLTLSIGSGVKAAVGRARPFERDCADDPQREGCDGPDRFHSFYSGHSAMAFTSAGFSCAMHLSRSLYDDQAADAASCGTSLALATTTGLMRVLADRHYLTDVLIGAVLGFVIGYIVPLAVVPERRAIDDSIHEPDADLDPGLAELPGTPGVAWSLAPMLAPPGLSGEGQDDDARASGPQATSASGSMSGVGGTVGLSVFGTF
ncbi:MAG: phosphatase PAP2 family protein [Myxococcota bacterium]|nr:phosphatase PAP2 family protein [Myxococcota bacterium]